MLVLAGGEGKCTPPPEISLLLCPLEKLVCTFNNVHIFAKFRYSTHYIHYVHTYAYIYSTLLAYQSIVDPVSVVVVESTTEVSCDIQLVHQ